MIQTLVRFFFLFFAPGETLPPPDDRPQIGIHLDPNG